MTVAIRSPAEEAAHARAALQQLDQGDDQAALGDQRAEQPFQKIRLHRLDASSGFLPQGFDAGRGFLSQGFDAGLDFGDAGLDFGDVGRDGGDVRLGGEVGVEEGDMLFGQRLGLLLGEAALGQALDEAMGVEGDGRGHAPIIATPPTRDKDYRYCLNLNWAAP